MEKFKQNIALCAGGTGGHINAALALGEDCQHPVYFTGQRDLDYKLFKDVNQPVFNLAAKPFVGKSKFELPFNLISNFLVFLKSLYLLKAKKIKVFLGCGGYVCGPVGLAAFVLGIPVYVLEQNSVMGMTNKLLCKIAKKIFLNFEHTIGFAEKFREKAEITGNPIKFDYQANLDAGEKEGQTKNILIFGGSLGAKEINESVFTLMERDKLHQKFNIYHQLGQSFKDYRDKIDKFSQNNYTGFDYIFDMQKYYHLADLIICRGGASTISELEIVGKPCIIIPYPHKDQHQFHNAQNLKNKSAFEVRVLKSSSNLAQDIFKSIQEINFSVAQKPMKNTAKRVILEHLA